MAPVTCYAVARWLEDLPREWLQQQQQQQQRWRWLGSVCVCVRWLSAGRAPGLAWPTLREESCCLLLATVRNLRNTNAWNDARRTRRRGEEDWAATTSKRRRMQPPSDVKLSDGRDRWRRDAALTDAGVSSPRPRPYQASHPLRPPLHTPQLLPLWPVTQAYRDNATWRSQARRTFTRPDNPPPTPPPTLKPKLIPTLN